MLQEQGNHTPVINRDYNESAYRAYQNINKEVFVFRGSLTISLVLSLWFVASAQMSIIGDESVRSFTGSLIKPVPLQLSKVTSPGYGVGETDYDWPVNGGGRRYICQSRNGGYHFYWSYRSEGNQNRRRAYYRYFQPPNTWSEIKMIDSTCGRMGALSQLRDGRAVATAHVTLDTLVGYNFSYLYIDSEEGAGNFQAIQLPLLGFPDSTGNIIIDSSAQPIWPNVTVGRRDIIYVTACQQLALTGWWTVSRDLGKTWSAWSDTLAGSYLDPFAWSAGGREVLVSRNNNVAIIVGTDNLKLLYYETTDEGRTWEKDTIFEFLPGDSVTPPNDSVFPYIWYSGVYDNDNVLHVTYTVVDTTPGGGSGAPYGSGWRSQIRYWNSSAQKNTIVTTGWWGLNPGPGSNHTTVAEAQIAIDRSTGFLYCTWTQADANDDVSAIGMNNLELYAALSVDNGETWIYQQNMTNSHTPAAPAGSCDSDEWHSISETASNDVLDVFYMNDKDAGSSVNDFTAITVNPMMYLKYAITPVEVKPVKNVSKNVLRVTMFPNPFRNRIEIRLADKDLADSKGKNKARLSIFATNGRLLREASFKKKYIWNGTDAFGHRLPAGIYLLQVNYNKMKYSSRIVLTK
jgi:hypothetical protein